MIFDFEKALFEKPFKGSYRVFDRYLIANILAFVRGFEFAIALIVAVTFLIIAVRLTIRQVRRLPKSYVLEILDLDGRQVVVDGLRRKFSTHDAAESYARFYRKMYRHQYKFKVIGADILPQL